MKRDIPLKTIERLIKYRRILDTLSRQGKDFCYSHEIAQLANNSSAQVRRDLMQIGYNGTAQQGYMAEELNKIISHTLDLHSLQNVILVGVGNLGKAILSYFSFQQPSFRIVAAFDVDEQKQNRVISGVHCYPLNDMQNIVRQNETTLGIITVPAEHAQRIADEMIQSGITGILNFAPVPLKVPAEVVVEELDITLKLQKIAFLNNK